jgi:hypothetical protein
MVGMCEDLSAQWTEIICIIPYSAGYRREQLIADLRPGVRSSGPANITVDTERIDFSANDGVHGNEVWMLPVN